MRKVIKKSSMGTNDSSLKKLNQDLEVFDKNYSPHYSKEMGISHSKGTML
jgi:hypothetical protein